MVGHKSRALPVLTPLQLYLMGSSGPVRRAPPCLNCRCGRTFSRPAPLAGFTRLRYGIVAPPLALGVWGVEIRPFRVRLVPAYPGSGFGRPASVRPVPRTIIRI